MDGEDITSTAYNNGTVSIASVTGNLVITAKAQMRPNFTNLVPLSVDKSGADFNVDGDGYDNGVYISTTETDSGYAEAIRTMKGIVTTGYIPVTEGARVIRVAGDGCSIDMQYTKIAVYDANFNLIVVLRYSQMGKQHADGYYYNGKLINEESTLFTVECQSRTNLARGVYIRVCTVGDGADLVVTVNEPITYG